MILTVLLFSFALAHADEPVYQVELKDHTMIPSEIHVKAGEAFWLEFKNSDNTSEEMESGVLNFEKVVPPRKTVKVKVGSLTAGSYELFGDFHQDKCKGKVVAGAAP